MVVNIYKVFSFLPQTIKALELFTDFRVLSGMIKLKRSSVLLTTYLFWIPTFKVFLSMLGEIITSFASQIDSHFPNWVWHITIFPICILSQSNQIQIVGIYLTELTFNSIKLRPPTLSPLGRFFYQRSYLMVWANTFFPLE